MKEEEEKKDTKVTSSELVGLLTRLQDIDIDKYEEFDFTKYPKFSDLPELLRIAFEADGKNPLDNQYAWLSGRQMYNAILPMVIDEVEDDVIILKWTTTKYTLNKLKAYLASISNPVLFNYYAVIGLEIQSIIQTDYTPEEISGFDVTELEDLFGTNGDENELLFTKDELILKLEQLKEDINSPRKFKKEKVLKSDTEEEREEEDVE